MLKLAITGHRLMPDADAKWVQQELRRWLERAADKTDILVISGMAIGVDTWWAETAVKLDIPFDAYIPYEYQTGWGRSPSGTWMKLHPQAWPEKTRNNYTELLTLANNVIDCSASFNGNNQMPGALLQHRNKCMVNDCDYLGVVWNGNKRGGTFNCLRYALVAEKRIHGFDVINQKMGWDLWSSKVMEKAS